MAKTDWAALQGQYIQEYRKNKTSPKVWCEANGLNYANGKRYIKIPGNEEIANADQKNSQNKLRIAQAENAKKLKARASGETPQLEKHERVKGSRGTTYDPPTNSFQKGNTAAMKHGIYSKRMLIPDDIVEDAKSMTLYDELHRLRANNLVAAESIGKYRAAIEDAEPGEIEALEGAIANVHKAMNISTGRIESLERTISLLNADRLAPFKMQADIDYRLAATDKVLEDIELLRSGGSGQEPLIVHNMLPMLGAD